MTAELAKETNFGAAFRSLIVGEQKADLRDLREKAFASFEANGFPTVRNEDWKYTKLDPIVGLSWTTKRRTLTADDKNELAELLDDFKFQTVLDEFRFDRNGLTALNLAFADFQFFRVPQDVRLDEPLEVRVDVEEGEMACPHVFIVAEAGSKVTIVESYSSHVKSFTNSAVQVVVKDNASVTHYRVQKDSPDAFNYGVTEVTVGRGSSYNSTNINLGGGLSRHDIDVKFTAEGGEAWVDGLYMIGGSQHHDTHSIIDHTVPNCNSHQNYRGVLNDKSRAVFNGKVFVRENASGTDAQQQNKNLLLSNDARVDTKPQLEIFNDDVKCSHGATVGQLEEEELFYLLTRGLPESLARNLLTYGFAEEIINKIEIESIKSELDSMVLNRLQAVI